MKCTKAWLVFALLGLALPTAGGAAELDEGFLGVPWGADLRHLEGFHLLYTKNELRYYVQPDTVREIDGIEVTRVVYGTFRHRFFAAYLDIDSIEIFDRIQSYMESRYGFPKTKWSGVSGRTTHRWEYNRVRIKLKADDSGNRMKLAFYDAGTADAANEDEADRAQENSTRFFPIDRDKKPDALPLLVF